MAAPAPMPPEPSRGVSRSTLVILCVGLLLVGVIAGIILTQRALRAPPGGDLFQGARPTDAEARVNILALCDAVQGYRDEHGAYLALAPEPKEVPRGGVLVPFPKEGPCNPNAYAPGEKCRCH